VRAPVDKTYSSADVSADLGRFLERPVRLVDPIEWPIGAAFEQKIHVWEEFLTNPAVWNKTQHFYGIRGNLHLKIQIAGNPFYSGRMLASYYPLEDMDAQTPDTVSTEYRPIRESQRIVGYIDPTTSTGCELMCPFYYPRNAIRLTSAADRLLMGVLTLRDVATLRSISEHSGGCYITLYAWMTEVSFVGQTYSSPAAAPPLATRMQMGLEKTEQDDTGPVSKVATAVQEAAGMLSKVPGVGPYAKATSVAAGGVASVARSLGYSRPTDLQSPQRFVNLLQAPMAVTNESIPLYKLAVDARNEVSIDPRVAGFPNIDELDIATLCSKETLLAKCTWQISDGADDILFNSKVSPCLFDYDVANGGRHMSPMAYIAFLFRYWRGEIDFRFQICSTAFHKGKLKVGYNALATQSMVVDERQSFNTGENLVIDISESRDFTVRVGWAQPVAYQRMSADIFNTRFETNAMNGTDFSEEANGMLTLSVLNQLRAPYANSINDAQVDILVYVKAGPNIKFAAPDSIGLREMMFGPADPQQPTRKKNPDSSDSEESLEVARPLHKSLGPKWPRRTKAQASVEPTAVCHSVETVEPMHYFGEKVEDDESDLIFFGESVRSLRPLLKRFCNYATWVLSPTEPVWSKMWVTSYPPARGHNTTPLPWKTMTLVHYIGGMFLARRGSMRWAITSQDDRFVGIELVQPGFLPNSVYNEDSIVPPNDFDRAQKLLDAYDSGIPGQQLVPKGLKMVEIPWYSRLRFYPCKDFTCSLYITDQPAVSFTHLVNTSPNLDAILSVSGGEDLTFHGFMSTPIIYKGQIVG